MKSDQIINDNKTNKSGKTNSIMTPVMKKEVLEVSSTYKTKQNKKRIMDYPMTKAKDPIESIK